MSATDAIYLPYARETALCVEVAYEGLEEDLRCELMHAQGEAEAVVQRLLERLTKRREVLEQFTGRIERPA